ncbi:unnamed protein product [Rotaria socialis]|nr:unnamed protein product [Rotaria socialis]
MMPAPNIKASSNSVSLSITIAIATRWIIVVLSIINLLKIFLEIILFRGFRVLFAQLFGLVTFLSTTIAFTPFKSTTDEFISWQWQLTAFSVLIQWFNIAVMHRSVPILGQFFVMVESVSIKFIFLLFVTCPLLIAFTISVKMLFFNHPAFATVVNAIHKSSTMITGEFDYETLFFSKSTFTAAAFLFIPFIVIMPIVFMNLLLGITIGDIQGSMERARTKANAYWIRELIYIESTLPSKTWLKHNIVEYSSDDNYINNSIENKAHNQDEHENESLTNQPHIVELGKLVDILDFLCTQTKQILDYEINLEQTVKQLLTIRKAQDSHRTISNRSSSV